MVIKSVRSAFQAASWPRHLGKVARHNVIAKPNCESHSCTFGFNVNQQEHGLLFEVDNKGKSTQKRSSSKCNE